LSVGKTLVLQRDYHNAQGVIRHYIDLQPEDSNGYIWMAECLYESRDYRALSTFLRAVPRERVKGWERFEAIESMWT
jgi:TolA-binding protein